MKHKQRGFTLIELLVVVLLIGILAAIALPQYQFAVAKSKTATFVSLMRSVQTSFSRYYMENNSYPEELQVLDTSFPCINTTPANACLLPTNFYFKLNGYFVLGTTPYNGIYITSDLQGITCQVVKNFDVKTVSFAKRLCIGLGAKLSSENDYYAYYNF